MGEQNIVEGPPLERILDTNLGVITLMMLGTHADSVVQVDAETQEEMTASLILNRGVHLAKWLQSIGLGHGDYISINSENSLDFAPVPVATFLIGATFAPLNPDYTPGELKHVINLTKPTIVFCSDKTIEKMISILPQHPYITRLVHISKNPIKHKIVVGYFDLLKGVDGTPKDHQDFIPPDVDRENTVATVLCSSGTTGLPKGVECTQENMVAYMDIARSILSHMLEGNYDTSCAISVVPFFHSFGFMTMFLNLIRGRKYIFLKKFSARVFLDAIVKYEVKTIPVPPPVILFLIHHPLAQQYDLSHVEEIICGAAPMSKELEAAARERFKGTHHVGQAYGMTETTLSVTINPFSKTKPGSVGLVVPGMKAKVIDEKGVPLGQKQEGELCFKGPLIMKGYVGDQKATADTIDPDGWLHTGDVGYYDEDGYFFVVDRLKELIKYNAFQVAPAELEALLTTHPAVLDAAVIGLPNEISGELPLAFIVKKPGANVTEQQLEKYVADNVSSPKRLRGGVYFIESIPRNPTGKILRRVLREKAKNMVKSKL